jgi:hypothetical protein
MITFNITNTIQEDDETIIVFVKYQDGTKTIEETARFSFETKVADILSSLKERAAQIETRELAVIEMIRQLREDVAGVEG